jgi:hypothetical protein
MKHTQRSEISDRRASSEEYMDLLLAFSREFDERSQTEISHPQIHIVVQHEVSKLEISMDHRVIVHIVASADELSEVVPSFRFRVASSSSQKIEK